MALGGSIEAARLLVGVGVQGVDKAQSQIGGLGRSVGGVGGFFRGAAQQALGFGGALIGLGAGAAAFSLIGDSVIGMNARLETSTLQFETLMGSASEAEAHVTGLFEFAKRTPFETGPIIEASRIMRTFGGDALDTEDNLTLFGDAAAATNAPINDIAFWMSRAYAAIQGGQPFGEARMRLMELGVITPQVANQLTELEEAGASGTEMWDAMSGSLDRFGGSMEKQAGTWEGVTSSLMDTLQLTIATALKPFFEAAKTFVGGALEFLSDPKVQKTIEAVSGAIVGAFGTVVDILGQAWSFIEPILSGIFDALGPIIEIFTGLGSTAEITGESLAGFAQRLGEGVLGMIQQLGPMLLEGAMMLGQWVIDAIPGLLEGLGQYMTSMAEWFVGHLPELIDMLLDWAGELVGWIIPNIPVILGHLATFIGSMVEWAVTRGLPLLVGAFVDIAGNIISRFIGAITGSSGGRGLLGEIGHFFTNTLIPGIARFIGEVAKKALTWGGSIVSGIVRGITSIPGKIGDALRSMLFAFLPFKLGPITFGRHQIILDLGPIHEVLASYQTGTSFVPATGPAILHRGEAVLPSDVAQTFRSMFGGARVAPPGAAAAGGGVTVVVNIGTFYGTEENVRRLGEELGRDVRLATLKRGG